MAAISNENFNYKTRVFPACFFFSARVREQARKMDRISPFWDRLFQFLSPSEQVILMQTCRRVSAIGNQISHFYARIARVSYAIKEHRLSNQTVERCRDLVLAHGYYSHRDFRYIHDHLFTPRLCIEMVKQNLLCWEFIPRHLLTTEICQTFITMHPAELGRVPMEFRTKEICLTAVKAYGPCLANVPMNLRTYEICLAAVKSSPNISVITYVPYECLSADLCLEAVKQNGYVLEDIPSEFLTTDICLEAVKQESNAIKYVPPQHQTREVCLAALAHGHGHHRETTLYISKKSFY